MLATCAALSLAFAPPMGRTTIGAHRTTAVTMQFPNPFGGDDKQGGGGGGFKMPSVSFPGIEIFQNPEKSTEFAAGRNDLRFQDTDGDVITLKPSLPGRVDFFVGNTLKIGDATVARQGENALAITGKVKKGTPLSVRR